MNRHSDPVLLSSGHGLLEAPLAELDGSLLFADATNGGVQRRTAAGAFETVISHRKGIGGILPHDSGGWIVSGRNVAYKPGSLDAPTQVLAPQNPDGGIIGYNDMTADTAGRVYVGSLGFSPLHDESPAGRTGFLHMIDLDGQIWTLWDGIQLTNGLGFSPDGSRLYHSDSLAHTVLEYDVHSNGALSKPSTLARVEEGIPDGIAIADDGSIFVAVAHGSAVLRFDPDGKEMDRLEFPVPMVTSLCFGGRDRDKLFVTTGLAGAPQELGGCLFSVQVNIQGPASPVARVLVPNPNQ